ncbi:MAG: methyltransferase domain-containing protein [Proteobacteria bacterium]|nr:methyltransferase domain-containing protein [Pseudomonadota bacterium]
MNITKADNLACPIDGNRLEQTENQYVCENGHTFDIARQGYVNLLPVQHKRSKQPGDSKAMVLARTRFLDTGIYQAIAIKLAETVSSIIIDDDDGCFLDAGCGEGYYFDFLFNSLKDREDAGKLSFIGLDISKDAVLQASKRNRQISWVVGTNRQLPVEDESVDIIQCLFGFLSVEGFNKALKPGGTIILVDPGPDHLKELREIIYPEVSKTKQSALAQMELADFSPEGTERLQFKTTVTNSEQINHLLMMTPHFYRASKEGREAVGKLDELDITVDVIFRVFKKI